MKLIFDFEYLELTKIHGEPNYLTILDIKKELKANRQSQCLEIGGGHYGYLSVIIPEATFLTLPTTAAVNFPEPLAPFTVPVGTIAVQSIILKSQWEMATKAYLEYVQMQLALEN